MEVLSHQKETLRSIHVCRNILLGWIERAAEGVLKIDLELSSITRV